MDVMYEESFGPVVGIMKVKNDEEAVKLMNDSPYGLTASIWTEDEDEAINIGDKVNTGTWFMNRCDYLDPYLSLGWCKRFRKRLFFIQSWIRTINKTKILSFKN